MISITVTVPVCEIGEYPEEYTPVAATHSHKLTKAQKDALVKYIKLCERNKSEFLPTNVRRMLQNDIETALKDIGW